MLMLKHCSKFAGAVSFGDNFIFAAQWWFFRRFVTCEKPM